MGTPQLRLVAGGAPAVPADGRGDVDPVDLVADAVIAALGDRALLLFRRRPWGHPHDLPLLVVVPSGVHLVAPLSFPGRRLRPTRDRDQVCVDGIGHSVLSRTMSENCDALEAALSTGPVPSMDMHAGFTVVAGSLPRRGFEVDGVPVRSVRASLRALGRRGPWDARAREAVHLDLSRRLERV